MFCGSSCTQTSSALAYFFEMPWISSKGKGAICSSVTMAMLLTLLSSRHLRSS